MRLEGLCLPTFCVLLVITGACSRSYGTNNNMRDDDSSHVNHNGDEDVDNIDDNDDDGINIDDDDYGGFNPDDENDKTIDEIIVDATNKDNTANYDIFTGLALLLGANYAHGFDSIDNSSDPKNKLIKIEYDMVFTQDELEQLNTNSSKDKRTAAIVNGVGGYRWTNNRIPYQIKSKTFNSYERNQIKAGINEWAKYTCLKFVPVTKGDRLYFMDGKGCSSRIGMKGGFQVLTLGTGCRVKSVVIHELGHAIGMKHEQSRPDRNSYVTIIDKNIPDDKKSNFKLLTWKAIQNLGLTYDYLSIMHYGARAFSKNSGITIKTLNPAYQNIIGTRKRLSFRDIKTVNLMYKCAKANKCKLTDSKCPGEGFVGTDCKCWCPGDPYTLCNMKATSCQDYNPDCPAWARLNHCGDSRYKTYMTANCRKSCRLCGGAVRTCQDENKYCPDWAKSGECQKNPLYMMVKCKKSCRVTKC